jgi:hypothetical protein
MGRLWASSARIATIVLALLLRWPRLSYGIDPDESALVAAPDFWGIVFDQESSRNPPLHRLFDLWFTPVAAIEHGRWFSLLSSLLTTALAFELGLTLEGIAGGVAAALFIAVNPALVEHAALYRAYAPWLAVATWHVLAAVKLLSGNSRGTLWAVQFSISALLLPWLHYVSLPLLALEALGFALFKSHRRYLWLLVPALFAAVPLPRLMLSGNSGPVEDSSTFSWFLWTLGFRADRRITPLIVIAAVIGFRKLLPVERLLWLAGLASAALIAALDLVLLVRPPAVHWLMPTLGIALALLPFRKALHWSLRAVSAAAVIGLLVSGFAEARRGGGCTRQGPKAVARVLDLLARSRAERPIYVQQVWLGVLSLYLTGERFASVAHQDPAGDVLSVDGLPFVPLESRTRAPIEGLVLTFPCAGALPRPDGCSWLRETPDYGIMDCHAAHFPNRSPEGALVK